jgi:hypothetical protein
MDYKKLNEILGSLRALRRKQTPVETIVVNELAGEGSQGEENEIYEVYSIPDSDMFIKLRISSDSYGDNEFIDGITFVKPQQKTVTNYEPIN